MDKVVFDRLSSFNLNHQQKRDLIDVIKYVSKDDDFEDTFILNIYRGEDYNFFVKQEDVPDLVKALLDKKQIVGKVSFDGYTTLDLISGNQFIAETDINTYIFSIYFNATILGSSAQYISVYGGMSPDQIDVTVNYGDFLTPEDVDSKFKQLENNINSLKKVATTEANGLMSKEDKVKLDSIDTDTTNYLTLEFTGITTDADNAKMNIANAVLKNPPLYADVKKVIDNKGFIYLKYNADGIDYCFAGAYAGYNERVIVFYIPNINILADPQGEQHINNINMQPIQCAITPDKSSNPIVQCELIECSDVIVNQLLMYINPAIMYVDGNEDGFTTIWTKQALKTQIDNGKRIYISPKPSSETIKKYPICYGFATSAKHGNNYYVTFNTIDKDSSPIQVVFYTTDDSTQLKVSVKGIATKEDIAKERTAREEADRVLTNNLATEVSERNQAILLEAETRTNADVELSNKINAEQTDRANADKVLTANLTKEITDRTNAVNAEATAREQADTAINEEIQGIKDKGTLHDLFLASGATYNDATKMYQLNGLDLTTEEMVRCYVGSSNIWQADSYFSICNSTNFKTTIKAFALKNFNKNIVANAMFAFSSIVVANLWYLRQHRCFISEGTEMFKYCAYLTSVQGLNAKNCKSFNQAFVKCSKLKDIDIIDLATNIDFTDSPLLSKESIVHLINHASPSSPITITLHPTAYAMATADPEIQAELEKQPNISLAEGKPSA